MGTGREGRGQRGDSAGRGGSRTCHPPCAFQPQGIQMCGLGRPQTSVRGCNGDLGNVPEQPGFPKFHPSLDPTALPSPPSQRKPVCVDSGGGAVTAVSPPSPDLLDLSFPVNFSRQEREGAGGGTGPIPRRCLLFLPLPPRLAKGKVFPENAEFWAGFGAPGTARHRTSDLFPLFPSLFSSPTPEFPVISPARRPSHIPSSWAWNEAPPASPPPRTVPHPPWE